MKLITIVLVSLTAMAVSPSSAQTQQKAAKGSTSSKQIAPADPLSSFKLLVKRFDIFFAAPQKLVEQQAFSSSPSGKSVMVSEYSVQDISYDVEKTNSLVSPYSATIQMKLSERSNESCGDVKGSGLHVYGWSTVKGAMSAIDRSDCYRSSTYNVNDADPDKPMLFPITLVFAFQDGKWVFTNAIGMKYAPLFLSIFGNATNFEVTHFVEPDSEALNSVWRDVVDK